MLGLGLGRRHLCVVHLGMRALQPGFVLLHLRVESCGVDLCNHLSGLDTVVVIDENLINDPRNLTSDIDGTRGLELACCRHNDGQVASPCLLCPEVLRSLGGNALLPDRQETRKQREQDNRRRPKSALPPFASSESDFKRLMYGIGSVLRGLG